MTDSEYHITIGVTVGHPDGPYGLIELAKMEAPVFELVKAAAEAEGHMNTCVTCCDVDVNGLNVTFHVGCRLKELDT